MDNDSNLNREVAELLNQMGKVCEGKEAKAVLAALGIQTAAVISQSLAPSIVYEAHNRFVSDTMSKILKKMKRKNKIN